MPPTPIVGSVIQIREGDDEWRRDPNSMTGHRRGLAACEAGGASGSPWRSRWSPWNCGRQWATTRTC